MNDEKDRIRQSVSEKDPVCLVQTLRTWLLHLTKLFHYDDVLLFSQSSLHTRLQVLYRASAVASTRSDRQPRHQSKLKVD